MGADDSVDLPAPRRYRYRCADCR